MTGRVRFQRYYPIIFCPREQCPACQVGLFYFRHIQQRKGIMQTTNHLPREERTARDVVSPDEAAELQARAASKVLRPARKHGFTDMQLIGLGRIASTPQVVAGEKSDWVILPTALDPLFQQAQLAAPPKARARIRELVNAGVWFDAVAIAHQVPPGTLACVKNSEELQQVLEPPMPKSLTVLSAVVNSLAARSSFAGKRIVQVLARSLDPMIIGAVVATPSATAGDAALFFLVTSWDY
jgi:hypothetical protein